MSSFRLPYRKHVLDNGLQVVLHEDSSNPLVSVCVVYHVGSAREERGCTGFAHLFEHLMFEGSKHVAESEHFKRISEAGGTLNGSTSRDRTNYYETLPAHHLELALWLESDRMGHLLPAMTQEKLDNQRDVVKNERRQSYENRPYAKALWPAAEALYPKDHPYSWLTIGSHEDLDAATLEDVSSFFRRWYGPNNATLGIGGDIAPDRALELAERWFGSIPRGPSVPRMPTQPVTLDHEVRRVVEDEVHLPELTLVWPTPPRLHEDEAALSLLLLILSANKSALLDKALMVDTTLANQVYAYCHQGELAGEFRVTLRASEGVSLETLEAEVDRILAQLAKDGVDPDQLQRQKNQSESQFIQQFETVGQRVNLLTESNAVYGDPARIERDLEALLAVTPEHVEDVFRRYLFERPRLAMSVVPKGRTELAAQGRTSAQIDAEQALDRSTAPQASEPCAFHTPALRQHDLREGVNAMSTPFDRIPLVAVYLSTPGGHLRERMDQVGVARMMAELMEEGTTSLSATEFTDELDAIGATLQTSSGDEEQTIYLQVLQKYLPRAMELFEQVALHPRFAPEDFARIHERQMTFLRSKGDHPRLLADLAWRRRLFTDDCLAALPHSGTLESLGKMTVDDVRAFYEAHSGIDGTRLAVVGSFDDGEVESTFKPFLDRWSVREPAALAPPTLATPKGLELWLVDKPGAAQTELRVGHGSIPRSHSDCDGLAAVNHVLGGSFNSRINTNLREEKGYTYGAHSSFGHGLHHGSFQVGTAVHTDRTALALTEVLLEIQKIREGITPDEATFAVRSLVEAMSRRYESVRSRCSLLAEIQMFELPHDFLERRIETIQTLTASELDGLAQRHIHADDLTIIAVGDAEAIRGSLEAIAPVRMLDHDGMPLTTAVS